MASQLTLLVITGAILPNPEALVLFIGHSNVNTPLLVTAGWYSEIVYSCCSIWRVQYCWCCVSSLSFMARSVDNLTGVGGEATLRGALVLSIVSSMACRQSHGGGGGGGGGGGSLQII